MTASLYLHIPFCAGACGYCDFYSVPVKPGEPRINRFIPLLLADVTALVDRFRVTRIPTLYLGGGTPSILGAGGIGVLLEGLRARLPEWPRELTLEANPESADERFLASCREGGVSRISLGIQSFHEPSRRMVHRVGEAALLPERLALVAEYYGEAFSADLMAGLPGQGEDLLLADIERLLAYHPGHVSLYALTVEPGTPLGSGGVPLPDPEEADRLWLAGRDALEKAGYAQYEVSNFALPGKQALHNIRYWRMENWLAAGPAASATVIDDAAGTGFRYTVAPDLERYLGEPLRGAGKIEFLDRLTLMKETCLMGFRYLEGPDREGFKTRFGGDIETFLPRSFAKWRAKGLMRRDKTALNREGLLFLNPFLADLFTELETGP